ncbi:hypothetical protein GK047_01485 [Paenibacillus sp. SYP-B3998]|uniref:Uncharacterized protein n=1 Tax=Paenibacillus sp. SYP-B3998 TaxID=2678564 RepID=A0A6G3ZSX8_9BACL|nr:hypothetical protein [Paenibacillus sp. SYP-B3998]NEW04691.1 hypothetical protein [Paenibacillus sp. SYP-B3998]
MMESLIKIIEKTSNLLEGNYVPSINGSIEICMLDTCNKDELKTYYMENIEDKIERLSLIEMNDWRKELMEQFSFFVVINQLSQNFINEFNDAIACIEDNISVLAIQTQPQRYHSFMLKEYLIKFDQNQYLFIMDILP